MAICTHFNVMLCIEKTNKIEEITRKWTDFKFVF